jgi:cytochrome c oxidase assembly protein subunit 15
MIKHLQNDGIDDSSSRAVARWLLIGVGMIIIQILIGGITRLTESGLSITEWKPVTGILPPMDSITWQAEFDKYKGTDQFKYVHQNFTLSEFKSIFFWEWFHRVWARMMGMVFLIGFIYFLVKKKFKKEMVLPMVILFLLGALQGAIGWMMVKSGLVPEKYFVGHVELATHFISAIILLSYTGWFALRFLVMPEQKIVNPPLRNLLLSIICILFFQLIYGAFMAGLKAGILAPTWPSINGKLIPTNLYESMPVVKNFIYNPIAIHFVHRGLAYILIGLIISWFWMARVVKENPLFSKLRISLLILVSFQVLLGILTVINSSYPIRLVWFGVSHQFVAMLLVMVAVGLLYLVRYRPIK